MKIIVEVTDDDAKLIEETMHMDVSKLVIGLSITIVECYKQLALASKSGITLDHAKAKEFGDAMGEKLVRAVYKYAHKET